MKLNKVFRNTTKKFQKFNKNFTWNRINATILMLKINYSKKNQKFNLENVQEVKSLEQSNVNDDPADQGVILKWR